MCIKTERVARGRRAKNAPKKRANGSKINVNKKRTYIINKSIKKERLSVRIRFIIVVGTMDRQNKNDAN